MSSAVLSDRIAGAGSARLPLGGSLALPGRFRDQAGGRGQLVSRTEFRRAGAVAWSQVPGPAPSIMGSSMPSHRGPRMGEAIREVVASAILFEAADPRIRAVTVLRVEVSPDFRQATVYVSVMGTEAEARARPPRAQARGRLLSVPVADRLQTRFTPVLTFKLDESVKKSVEISRLIDEAIASDRKPDPSPADDPAATDGRRRGITGRRRPR